MGFLPVFFILLALAFCMALWLRIRSYAAEEAARRPPVDPPAADSSRAPVAAAPQSNPAVTAEGSRPRSLRKTVRDGSSVPLLPLTPAELPHAGSPPVVTAQTPSGKPSLVSRLMSPIMNAVTGGGTRAPSSSPSPANAPRPVQSSGGRPATDTTATSDPRDRSSDTQPPQLLSIFFNPPQVRDGEETVLTVQAVDDLSGIRSISGTIAAPSGAVQGFALQREQESDRYLSHITVPKDAAEGLWHVNYLSLIDNASNATTISGAMGALPPTASFRVVSSRPDSTGPTLKAVWVDRPAMKAGEKNRVFVDADDDKSGVNLVSGVFISPAKHARIGFVCRVGSGPWECELTTPVCIDCGEWTLEQLQLQDKANNMTTIRADNPLIANVRVNISSDRCDAVPPVLQALLLDRSAVSNADDSIVNATATAIDDACGIMSMSGQISGPSGPAGAPRLYFSFTAAESGRWIARISVPKLAAKGLWRVTWVQVLDQGHNLKTYSQGDAALANAVFSVQ